MEPSDTTLVEQTLAGEPSAFEELARRYRPGLVRFSVFMVSDADEAESVAQETLTRALERLSTFRRELAFGAWLHGIALNVCRNTLRQRTQHAKPVPPEQLADTAAREGQHHGVLSGILRREINERTVHAMSQLPAPLREAFVLHFMEGFSYADMSQITGQAAGTLRVRAHRARTLLRQQLGDVVDTWLREAADDGA